MPEQNANYSPEEFNKKFLDNVISNVLYDMLCTSESTNQEAQKILTAAKIIGEKHGIPFLEMFIILTEFAALNSNDE